MTSAPHPGDTRGPCPFWLETPSGRTMRTAETLPARVEVVVIGGGITGVSVAYWLARAGRQVLVVERRGIAGGCDRAQWRAHLAGDGGAVRGGVPALRRGGRARDLDVLAAVRG